MSSYDDLLQGFSSEDKKKDRLASSLSEAAVTNPDEFANMVKLSKAASISIESIPDYKNEAEQAKYLGEVGFSRLWKDAPKTSEFLSDPTNAKLARNDVPAMGFLERKIRSLGDGVVGLGGSALSGTGYTLDAMQRRILMGAASFLPKPMAGGEVTDESIVGQTMGDDWRYVAAPLKDASKSISVPKDKRDFGDDVMQAIGQIGGQFALGPLNLPTMFAQGVDMQAERSIKDNASQANKDWSMLGSGAWTMITEKVLGIDRWAKMGPLTSIKNPVGARVGGVGLAAASEGVQETLENVGQDALRKGLTNENADIGFGDAAYAGGVGATAAGVVRSFIESALHIKARRTQEFFTDLGDAAKQSELINRAPDKMSEFVAQAAQGGPVENVFIPSDQFVRYFQEVGADPVEAAQAMGVINYTEAIAAGTDVIIPLGEFAARVAPSEHLQGLMPDLRLHQGDATARELMAMEADRDTREAYLKQQLESLIAEGETSRGLNLAIDRITQDVEGQLLGAGVEPSTARTQAQVMRGVAVLAQRAFPNEEPLAAAEKLWSQYGLTVSRELPPILTKLKNADVQLDPLLDRLRAAAMPSQTEVFGQPLHEFLRAMGGVQDQGGELSARDADVGNAPFVKNLIQAAGLDIDGAREIAAQQGFPVGESEADFISALTASFEGNPVYSPNQENPQALDLLQTLESLDKALKDSGVDLNAVDNATARKMLEQAGEVSGARFDQSVDAYQGDTIEIDGIQRSTVNSNGKPIAQTEEGLRNFWRWFGDSKVVDADGKPMVVYHGTASDIKSFDIGKSGESTGNTGFYGKGAYFTEDPDYAAGFGFWARRTEDDAASVIPAYLSLQKPAYIHVNPKNSESESRSRETAGRILGVLREQSTSKDVLSKLEQHAVEGKLEPFMGTLYNQFGGGDGVTAILIRAGFDGILVYGNKGGKNFLSEVAAFSPTQIKSATGNRGTFDPASPNILYQSVLDNGTIALNALADKDTVAGTQAPTSAGDGSTGSAIDVDGVMRPALDSRGNRIASTESALRDFWKWFGDSKVVDSSGRPLVVFHGTTAKFTEFDRSERGTNTNASGAERGFFFAGDSSDSNLYVEIAQNKARKNYEEEPEGRILKVYLKADNPLILTPFEEANIDDDTVNELIDSDPVALDYAVDNGFDAVIWPHGNMNNSDYTAVVFQPDQIRFTNPNEPSASAGSDVLYQSQDKKRGFMQIGPNRQMQIGLTENSNLSTFLHETGHFYLEVMGDLAGNADAAQQVKDDYAAILKWMGVTDRSQIKTEQHEQFARANEAYLREGKAPAQELQGAFQRFKAWLSYLYRNLASLNVTLNDEVRAVFDRIYATDAEIDAASDKVDVAPLFLTAELMGMSPEEFALYRERVGKVSAYAQDKLLTKLMREYERGRKEWWKEERANVREEVAAEVDAQPVYRAFAALVAGEFNGQPFKLNKADLVARFGEPYLKTLPRGFQRIYAGDGGIDVEMAAEVFGYATGDDLIKALVEMRNRKELIEAEADARMKERHGDMLTDGTAAVAAVEALHNDERANVLAVELRALNRLANAMEPARKLERQKAADEQRARVAATETPNLSWFKSAAQGRLEQMVLRDINPNSYLIAGRRAAREAFAALARNDHQTAAAAKQRELLNHYLYMESVKAKADLDKVDQRFKKMLTGSDEKTAKSRDLDLVMAARAILADFGYGGKAKKAAAYLEKVKDYDPATHAVLMQSVEAAEELAASLPPNSKGPALRDLTTLQLRALADEVEALWFLAKRNRTMEIDGNLIDLQEIDDQLLSRLTDIGIPFRVAGEGYAITEGEMKIKDIRTFIASARRVEHWVDAIDGKEGENKIGLFRKYVWSPISDAAVAYRADKAKFLRKFRESFKNIEETLKPKIIAADELGYVFGKDSGGSAMNEILHAILHTGNESNKRKLLLGRNWATLREDGSLDTSRWDSFVSRMISEGNITKAHYDFAQSIWDLLESMKPMAQKTHREVFGKYFDEVTAQEFVTPFGIYRGGYVPAMADSRIVSDAAMRDLQEQENQAMSFAFPTTSKGFTKARTEYNRPLMLDMRSLAQHIDKVLMFSRMEIPVRDVRKALGKEAGQALARIDPTIIGGMITPWLNRAAKQQVETPISGAGRLMRFFSVIRSRAGAAAMFGNLVNTAQQITGFSLAALKVKPSLMLSSTADYMKHPGKFTKAVSEASPYMATRMENEVAAMSGEINDILLNPSLLDNGQNWAMKHAYFMQSAVDNVMSPIIWTAAYNQAIEGGNDHKDAVRLADAAVRQTQGSTQPEDISRIEGGNAFVRMFTQFAGYFNMQANLLGAQFITLSRDYGLMNSKGRAFFIFTAGFLIPAMMSEVIVQAFRGGPDDEDKDGEYLDDWLSALFMGSVRTATAMVPVVGQGVMSIINASNSKPYDDRLATPPAISMLESAARAPFSATKAINGEGSNQKAVRDVATLVSMTLGIPVNVAAKPIGYASGVSDGRISPTSNADMVRGSITGVASADSKR